MSKWRQVTPPSSTIRLELLSTFQALEISHINGGVSTSSAQIAFNSAIGVAGSITVSGTHEFLASYYDITDSPAVFITVHSTAGTIAFNADVDVIATIGMSQATYDAMGNVAFT